MALTQSEKQQKALNYMENLLKLLTDEVSNIFYHNLRVLTFFRAPTLLLLYRPLKR